MSFYIEKIIVTGSGKTDSIIELSSGVNIIYGPSNTGKTYIVKCIDYMFGSEREPIDISAGYRSEIKNY
jgi:AAA15 family ATPase/GTPase